MNNLTDKSILLVISGGIAAYKSLELIRLIKKSGGRVRCILTKGGAKFVTPLSVSSLCEEPALTDLWENPMDHIRLSREAGLIIVAPASADIIAKMAHGMADDLATTTLLAANKPIIIAPAMNVEMWQHPATQDNIKLLQKRGIDVIQPAEGDMACGETGMGRMPEPADLFEALSDHPIIRSSAPLQGRKALVTAGPTFEPIDPVRFIGNHSSGKQGYAIAAALHKAGAQVTLISGPSAETPPPGVNFVPIQTAAEMLAACENALPADIAVFTAAVSDWSPETPQNQKIKKSSAKTPPAIALKENPDILRTIATHKNRPALVIGFAAETENLIENAKTKLTKKACDLIVANDVAAEKTFGADENHVYLIDNSGVQEWPKASKTNIARQLTQTIIERLKNNEQALNAAE